MDFYTVLKYILIVFILWQIYSWPPRRVNIDIPMLGGSYPIEPMIDL